ncbi:MAG: hypothetical protein ABSD99_01405 [Candidatus Bathyarchaeia archaeon]
MVQAYCGLVGFGRWKKGLTKRRIPHLEGESVRIFREAVRAEETWLQYERRFWRFLDWLGETPNSFFDKSRNNKPWVESKIIEYIMVQKDRVRKKEISESTVPNFKKPVKLFLEMNDVTLNWKKINKKIPSFRRYALDRAPAVEELRRLIRYPDMRVEVVVLVMVSSAIRVGAWDYLKIRGLKSLDRDGKAIAARLTVYEGEPEEYVTFITPEAYDRHSTLSSLSGSSRREAVTSISTRPRFVQHHKISEFDPAMR